MALFLREESPTEKKKATATSKKRKSGCTRRANLNDVSQISTISRVDTYDVFDTILHIAIYDSDDTIATARTK